MQVSDTNFKLFTGSLAICCSGNTFPCTWEIVSCRTLPCTPLHPHHQSVTLPRECTTSLHIFVQRVDDTLPWIYAWLHWWIVHKRTSTVWRVVLHNVYKSSSAVEAFIFNHADLIDLSTTTPEWSYHSYQAISYYLIPTVPVSPYMWTRPQ